MLVDIEVFLNSTHAFVMGLSIYFVASAVSCCFSFCLC